LLIEGTNGKAARERRLTGFLPAWVSRQARQQAVLAFLLQTLGRSSRHRMILMGYAGIALALFFTGIAGMGRAYGATRAVAADFVYYHILALLFLLFAARHLFSLPTELKANWIFQITEGEGRADWLRAVDRFVLLWGGAPMLLVPLPAEVRLLGWRGAGEAALFLFLGLLAYEWVFASWDKLPFTCSRLPSKTPIWMILAFIGLLGVLSMLHTLLLSALYDVALFASLAISLLAGWWWIHRVRQERRAALRIQYEEAPVPAIHGLNLLRR
jgi:hypothetical protein